MKTEWGCGCRTYPEWWAWLIREFSAETRFVPDQFELGATNLTFHGVPFAFCPFCGKKQFPTSQEEVDE